MDTNKDKAASTAADKATSKTTADKATADKTATTATPANDVTGTATGTESAKAQTSTTAGKSGEKPLETAKGGPLFKLFTDGLKDIYFAEKHILKALPKMQKAATTSELQEAFEDHYLITQKHVSRLEKVFKMVDEKAEEKTCDAIIGIVKEGEKCIEETEEGSMTRDAALIIAAQKVEHYEIASYGGLAALAETMKLYDASELLHKTLEEEENTDLDLTEIAETYINFGAAEDDEDMDDDDDFWSDDEDEEDYDDEEEYDDDEEYEKNYI